MLQYYWVDRYAGMLYPYNSRQLSEVTRNAALTLILLSTVGSFIISLKGVFTLFGLYSRYKIYLNFKIIDRFLDDKKQVISTNVLLDSVEVTTMVICSRNMASLKNF